MNLSIQKELQPFAEELKRYITPEFLGELAKEMKFIKWNRKFSGLDLATICIWMSQRATSDPWCIYFSLWSIPVFLDQIAKAKKGLSSRGNSLQE